MSCVGWLPVGMSALCHALVGCPVDMSALCQALAGCPVDMSALCQVLSGCPVDMSALCQALQWPRTVDCCFVLSFLLKASAVRMVGNCGLGVFSSVMNQMWSY